MSTFDARTVNLGDLLRLMEGAGKPREWTVLSHSFDAVKPTKTEIELAQEYAGEGATQDRLLHWLAYVMINGSTDRVLCDLNLTPYDRESSELEP